VLIGRWIKSIGIIYPSFTPRDIGPEQGRSASRYSRCQLISGPQMGQSHSCARTMQLRNPAAFNEFQEPLFGPQLRRHFTLNHLTNGLVTSEFGAIDILPQNNRLQHRAP
jgi:hypothetical protein